MLRLDRESVILTAKYRQAAVLLWNDIKNQLTKIRIRESGRNIA